MSASGYKHQAVPPRVRDVNHVICTNGESSLFHYIGKGFRSYQRITAKPPSCLHFLRESLKFFPIPMYFHCLTCGKWKKCGSWEREFHCILSKAGGEFCSAAGACSIQAATITEKRRGCKRMSPLHLSLHLPAQNSGVRSADSPGWRTFQRSNFNWVKCVINNLCGNKGLSSLFFFTSSKF